MDRRDPSYGEDVHTRFTCSGPSQRKKQPYVSVPRGGRLDYVCCVTGGANPCPRGGVAYIECARTPGNLHYKWLNVHKVRVLLVTAVLNTLNAHED